jgi:hypothetical protein
MGGADRLGHHFFGLVVGQCITATLSRQRISRLDHTDPVMQASR